MVNDIVEDGLFLTTTPGLGGRLKESDADFVVREISPTGEVADLTPGMISDSEDDADVDDLDESELDRERRRVNDEFKEVRPHRASRSIDVARVNLFQPPPSLTRRARLASRSEPRRNSRRSSRSS